MKGAASGIPLHTKKSKVKCFICRHTVKVLSTWNCTAANKEVYEPRIMSLLVH